MGARLAGPSWAHPLGTDELGRDLLSRLIFGARVSVSVGAVAVAIASCFGAAAGLVGAYRGGRTDTVVMRVMDGLLAFPSIILALAIMAVLGPRPVNAMIAIGVVYTPVFSRVVRSSVLTLRHQEFVDAVRALGASDAYVMIRTILPNCASPLLIQMTVGFANAILTEAALSFLGLGVQAPTPSWGAMLNTGRQFLTQTAWYSFSSGAAIFLAVLSLNLVGDGLRDCLDPRLRARRAVELRGQNA
jgi:peptide/nickel transport system permease protein